MRVGCYFAEALAKERKLTSESVGRILDAGMVELFLPDCHQLEDRHLVEAFQRLAELDDPDDPDPNPIPNLRILRLGWCGRCFGKRAVEALGRLRLGQGLEMLELVGLYSMPDALFKQMLSECPRLVTLNVPYKSTLSLDCVRAVLAADTITSLSLAYCPQVGVPAAFLLTFLLTVRPLHGPSSVLSGATSWCPYSLDALCL